MAPIMKRTHFTHPAMFYNTQPLTHTERRRVRELNAKRRLQCLTAAETLERAALRFRSIGMEVD